MFVGLPVTALRTFEAAARLGSFRAAAAELSVSPTAVSHQVRNLERRLGVRLFERVSRGVRLSGDGERLFRVLHNAFVEIGAAMERVRPLSEPAGLRVSVTASFAALWLIPRLHGFRDTHPHLDLRIDTRGTPVDLDREGDIDVAIRYGETDHPRYRAVCSMTEEFAAYGAPAVVAATHERPAALITVSWNGSTLYERVWRQWCAAAGVDWLDAHIPAQTYDEEHYALQAAVAGHGLVMGSSALVTDLLRNGLLEACKPRITVPGARYVALCAPGRERHPPVGAFLAWLESEFHAHGVPTQPPAVSACVSGRARG